MKRALVAHHAHSTAANSNVIVKKAEVDRNAINAHLDTTSIYVITCLLELLFEL